MSSGKSEFQLCLQQSSETTQDAVQQNSPPLNMMWALEDCDHMALSCELLDLPEWEPTWIPTLRFERENVRSVTQAPKRRSLARLRRERALLTTRLEGQTSGATHLSNDVDAKRERLKNELSLPSRFLAGAAALGLRRRRNRAISEPPVQPHACSNRSTSNAKHSTNNVKERVRTDERSAKARSEQQMKEVMLVPRAPTKPQPGSHRNRPQIRGVPILVVPTS